MIFTYICPMAILSENSVNQLVIWSKANGFNKMMLYGQALTIGVAEPPYLKSQSNFIFAASSDYATLLQKNTFANKLSAAGDDVVFQDGYGVNNYWSVDYAE